MSELEFSHMVDLRGITDAPVKLVANEAERAALAQRFGIVAIKRFAAEVSLERDGEQVTANGQLIADVVQPCAVSGDDLAVHIDEPFALRFVPAAELPDFEPDEEIELTAEELDEIPYEGTAFDLGEAAAQSLALAIDPYRTGPNADAVRAEKGLAGAQASGPLAAALAGLNLKS